MSVPLIRLRGALDDETEELRALLAAHDIDFYETPAGNWGISMPAIWLRDEAQLDAARRLVEDYQRQRAERAREEYARLRREGRHRTLLHVAREHPLRFMGFVALAAFVVYLSTVPFLGL